MAAAEVTLKFDDNGRASLINTAHGTQPAVFHGNGPSKMYLNTYGNYIADAFVNGDCVACAEQRIELLDTELPTVTVALFVVQASPFFADFLKLFKDLDYPNNKQHVIVYSAVSEKMHFVAEYSISGTTNIYFRFRSFPNTMRTFCLQSPMKPAMRTPASS